MVMFISWETKEVKLMTRSFFTIRTIFFLKIYVIKVSCILQANIPTKPELPQLTSSESFQSVSEHTHQPDLSGL